MRLVKTQAKETQQLLKKAEVLVNKAIKTGNYKMLYRDLIKTLGDMPEAALPIIKKLALYEAEFIAKHMSDEPGAVIPLPPNEVLDRVNTIKISTSIDKPAQTITKSYQDFAVKKTSQYLQTIRDSQALNEDPEVTQEKVSSLTNGLFTTQNLALAGLAILGTANTIRADVIDLNGGQVDWVLDLELNNCMYCQDMAAGSPYDPQDVEGEIPAHANCGCTLVPTI